MKLLTNELLKQLPPCERVDEDKDPMIYAKFFTPDAGWTWYVAGVDARESDDKILYGYVVGDFPEWGHFSLSELQSVRGKLGLPVERDLYFAPKRWSELKKEQRIED
jgi:hypothetical protein